MLQKFLKAFYEGNEYEPVSLSLEDFRIEIAEYSDVSILYYCRQRIAVYGRQSRKLHLCPAPLAYSYYDNSVDEKVSDYLLCINFLNDLLIYGQANNYI